MRMLIAVGHLTIAALTISYLAEVRKGRGRTEGKQSKQKRAEAEGNIQSPPNPTNPTNPTITAL
jgi:hypothetical protein